MYYIYALIDPRNYQYFYIGKGKRKNNRHLDHLREKHGKINPLKWHRIQKIRSLGMDVLFEVIIDNILDENIAYDEETRLIKLYGKIVDGTGILTNIIDDAKPPSWKGRVKSEEHRKNLSKAHLGKKLSQKTIDKIRATKLTNGTLVSNGMTGKTHSDETKEKIRLRKIGTIMSQESSLKKSEKTKGRTWSEERRLAAMNGKKTGPKSKTWSEARRAAHNKCKSKEDKPNDNKSDSLNDVHDVSKKDGSTSIQKHLTDTMIIKETDYE